MKRFIPYLLPVVSVFIIGGFLIFNPSITGFITKDIENIPKVNVETRDDLVIPEDSLVVVSLDETKKSLALKEFIKKTQKEYKIQKGRLDFINYEGLGYTGNYKYSLDLLELGFEKEDVETFKVLKIEIFYRDNLISNSRIEF